MCRSKFSDEEIGLIPEDEFMSSAPEQFKDGCEDPHKRMLQRLDHEKHMRIEAMKAVDEEKSRRDALVAKAAQQRANILQLEVRCRQWQGELRPNSTAGTSLAESHT